MPTVRRVVRSYGVSAAVKDRKPGREAFVLGQMRERLQHMAETQHLQIVSDFQTDWEQLPDDKALPWRVQMTCEAIKLGRRKELYQIAQGIEDTFTWLGQPVSETRVVSHA